MKSNISKTTINFWLDVLLLLLFLLAFWTALVIRFLFPPGPEAAGWTLWSWNYTQWSDFQFGVMIVFALAVLLHVMLHWPWVCGVVATRVFGRKHLPKDDGSFTLWGVGLIIAIVNVVGGAFAAAALSIAGP